MGTCKGAETVPNLSDRSWANPGHVTEPFLRAGWLPQYRSARGLLCLEQWCHRVLGVCAPHLLLMFVLCSLSGFCLLRSFFFISCSLPSAARSTALKSHHKHHLHLRMPSVYVKQVQPSSSWRLASTAHNWQNLRLLFKARRLCSLQVIVKRWGPDPTHYAMDYCLAFTPRGSLLTTFITTVKWTSSRLFLCHFCYKT